MTEARDVVYATDGSLATLTIDRREKRNALRGETLDELFRGLERAAGDGDVHCLCITGAGDRAFCAGADLGATGKDPAARGQLLRRYAELLKTMSSFDKPLIARVAGHCVGGGMGLMLACDLVIAAEDVRFGTPEVNVGLFPMMVAALLPRGASRKRVLEMVFTGELISAQEAERLGLITRAVPRGELDVRVATLGERIATRAPLAVSMGRKAWVATEDMTLDAALDHLCGQLETLMQTEDAAEGIGAFAEKREPTWKGR